MSENRPPLTPLMPVAEARARILAGAGARMREIEMVPIDAASGRVLAADLAAKRTQPPFAMSAMDGFALLAADTDPPGESIRTTSALMRLRASSSSSSFEMVAPPAEPGGASPSTISPAMVSTPIGDPLDFSGWVAAQCSSEIAL